MLTQRSRFTAGVAMFSQDPAVEAAGVDPQLVGYQEAESRRVQVGATTDDAVLGEPTQFPGHVGQHVDCRGERRLSEERLWGRGGVGGRTVKEHLGWTQQ